MSPWLAALVGLAEGLAVGTAFVAFFSALGIAPRLASLTGTHAWARRYEVALLLGALAAAGVQARPVSLAAPWPVVSFVALGMGLFIGLSSAALAEVVDVLPVLTRRLGLSHWLAWLVFALAAGKAVGAALAWLIPSLWGRPPA